MAGNTNKKIYLDTCFIIDWLTLNQSSPDSMEIGGVINAILGNKIKEPLIKSSDLGKSLLI
jgi:hypothetical protein